MNDGYTLNRPAALACPECGGTLRVDRDGPVLRYVCHIGHVLTGEAMLVAAADRIEHQATGLLAMLNEQRELYRQLIEADEGDRQHLEQLRSRTTRKAEIVRDFLNRSLID
jgi:two-component system, chemotaxis family, protein-glutamate methylesterase/glutaminase